MFPAAAGGYGIKEQSLAYWNCLHGATVTFTVKQLGIHEETVSRYYKTCRRICAHDAVRMQNEIVFGGRYPKTTDIEYDEHCFRSWRVGSIYYFYCWLGFEERGSAGAKFHMTPVISTDPAMLPGVTHSSDEARVPPLSKPCFHDALDATIKEDTCAIGMSDSAIVYVQLKEQVNDNPGWHGFQEVHVVNHSATPPERAISISVLDDVSTGDRRPGKSGTQMIDGAWKYVDDVIPEKLNVRPDTEDGNEMWTEWVRFGQWMHMIGTADKYQAFCTAAQHFEEANAAEKVKLTCRVPTTNVPQKAIEDKVQAISDAVVALELETREASKAERFEHCVVLQKKIKAAQERSRRIQRNRNMHAAKRLGSNAGRVANEAEAVAMSLTNDGVANDEPDDEVEFLGVVEPNVQEYGLEWKETADVDWGHFLGYTLKPQGAHVFSQRGCVNKELTHCFVVSLLQALSSMPRVKIWCQEHTLCCRREPQEQVCILCELAADLAALEESNHAPLEPCIVEHRSLWAQDWVQAKQECAMEAFSLLMPCCDQVDRKAAEVLGGGLPEVGGANAASERTFPSLQIFGGLLKSSVACNYPPCKRKTCKYEIMNHIQINIPTGRLATVKIGIEQAQAKQRLLKADGDRCPACMKSLRTKVLEVEEWPSTLVVQVKRWQQGSLRRRWSKNQCNIGFEESMELGGWQYYLRAVVVHSGGASRGHCYTYGQVGGQWRCYNDTEVSDCSWADVLRDQAFLLFYESDMEEF